jgi:hypothetical protein
LVGYGIGSDGEVEKTVIKISLHLKIWTEKCLPIGAYYPHFFFCNCCLVKVAPKFNKYTELLVSLQTEKANVRGLKVFPEIILNTF